MKITYERLNQIIEEEVVKFKRLNEDTPLAKDPTMVAFETEITRIRGLINDSKEETARLTTALRAIK